MCQESTTHVLLLCWLGRMNAWWWGSLPETFHRVVMVGILAAHQTARESRSRERANKEQEFLTLLE